MLYTLLPDRQDFQWRFKMQYENGLLVYLQNNGITQSDVALGSRVSHVTINKICNKKLSPSKTLVGKIAKYLTKDENCSMADVQKMLPEHISTKKEK
jgi:transcriptional regulator with XRE-family HTH domain